MNSLKLAARCYNKGFLSKEAFEDVLRVRERLIKEAVGRQIATRFAEAGRGAARNVGGFFKQLKGSLGFGGMTRTPAAGGAMHPKARGPGADAPSSWADVVANLGKLLALGGAAGAASAGVTGIMQHRKQRDLKEQIQTSYGRMFKEYPALEEMDRQKVGRHFGVLARYAPSLAADPLVAGSWVKSTTQMDYIDPDAIRRLSDTQTAIDKAHEGRALFQPGQFRTGVDVAKAALV